MFKNKRADTSIALLIFMTVFLCGTALFVFLINENDDIKKIASVSEINSFYEQTDMVEFFSYNVARDIFYKNKAISETDFINSFKKEYYETRRSSEDILTPEQLFNYDQVLIQLKNEKNYDITIKSDNGKRTLVFVLKGVEFSKSMKIPYDSSIASIKYVRDIEFELTDEN
jgi:hypothetical protein